MLGNYSQFLANRPVPRFIPVVHEDGRVSVETLTDETKSLSFETSRHIPDPDNGKQCAYSSYDAALRVCNLFRDEVLGNMSSPSPKKGASRAKPNRKSR